MTSNPPLAGFSVDKSVDKKEFSKVKFSKNFHCINILMRSALNLFWREAINLRVYECNYQAVFRTHTTRNLGYLVNFSISVGGN